jgi:hypothetical protein
MALHGWTKRYISGQKGPLPECGKIWYHMRMAVMYEG